jgi:hypothetical protein
MNLPDAARIPPPGTDRFCAAGTDGAGAAAADTGGRMSPVRCSGVELAKNDGIQHIGTVISSGAQRPSFPSGRMHDAQRKRLCLFVFSNWRTDE